MHRVSRLPFWPVAETRAPRRVHGRSACGRGGGGGERREARGASESTAARWRWRAVRPGAARPFPCLVAGRRTIARAGPVHRRRLRLRQPSPWAPLCRVSGPFFFRAAVHSSENTKTKNVTGKRRHGSCSAHWTPPRARPPGARAADASTHTRFSRLVRPSPADSPALLALRRLPLSVVRTWAHTAYRVCALPIGCAHCLSAVPPLRCAHELATAYPLGRAPVAAAVSAAASGARVAAVRPRVPHTRR